ncbi:MAG: hypothetical protein EHM61_23390 [Acidobacteria bacterium]|nr:MAG: hypothetical protein EHM61_23390 [Acidobacteriota bacterium]
MSTKRWVCLAFVVLAVPGMVAADDSKATVFGGYSFCNLRLTQNYFHGFGLGVRYDLHPNFGVAADFSNTYSGEDDTFRTFHAGPVLMVQTNRIKPFLHVLLGARNLTVRYQVRTNKFVESETALSVLTGGGLDIDGGGRFGWRAVQADFVYHDETEFGEFARHPWDLKLSTGIILRF